MNDSIAVFYTYGVQGKRPLVLSAVSTTGVSLPIELISPFANLIPKRLPHLVFHYNRSEVETRSIDMQRHQMAIAPAKREIKIGDDADDTAVEGVPLDYDETILGTRPDLTYNLDEYRQFFTVKEVLLEYVNCVTTRKVNDVPQLMVRKEQGSYDSSWPTMVFIDGMPVVNVERLLDYDARRVHYINIYSGQYTFGNGIYNGILSFVTRSGRLTNYPVEQKNKYKYVSVGAMVAVMLLLGLYMWMTYRSAVTDISERAGNQLTWGMFYESYQRAEVVSVGDTLSLPHLRGDLSLESSVEGMNDVLSRRYHSEVSLDTLAQYVDSLLSVVSLDRNFTLMEVDADGSILRQNNDRLSSAALKTRVFSTRRDQSRGIRLALNNPYPTLARRLSPLFAASAIILILFGAILLRLLRYLDEQKMMADLRNDFSYAMVHDMKSPLSSIIMGARFLHSGKVDDKPEIKEKYYAIIESEAEHLLALVNKLLTISKLENKKLILNKQDVNLEPIIDDIVEKAKAKTDKNIDFIVDLLERHVLADEQYLAEAISNLVDNAIKYSKENIEIRITTQGSDKYVLLKVRDNGIGISREDQRIIFDKFGRAAVHEKNRKGGVSGFGLGLNYVDQVMQAHGGKVTVTSEKDKYSEFTLYIPK